MAYTDGYITDNRNGGWQYSNTGGTAQGDISSGDVTKDAWARVRRFDANSGSVAGTKVLINGTVEEGPVINFTAPGGLLSGAPASYAPRPYIVWAGVSPMSLQEVLIVWNDNIVLLDKSGITGGDVATTVGRLMILSLPDPISINGIENVTIGIAAGSVGIYRKTAGDACDLEDEEAQGMNLDDFAFPPFDPYVPECDCIDFEEGSELEAGADKNVNNLSDGLIFCDMCNADAQCGEFAGTTGVFAVNNTFSFPVRCTVPFVLLELKVCDCNTGGDPTPCEYPCPIWLISMVVFGSTMPMEVKPLNHLVQIYPCDVVKGTYLEDGVPAVLSGDAECCAMVDASVRGTSGPAVRVNGRWRDETGRLPGYAGQVIKFIYHCTCDPCDATPPCEPDDCINVFFSEVAQCWIEEDIIKPIERTSPVSFFTDFEVGTVNITYQPITTDTISTISTYSTADIIYIKGFNTSAITLIANPSTSPLEYVEDFAEITVTGLTGLAEGATIEVVTDFNSVEISFQAITVVDAAVAAKTITSFDNNVLDVVTTLEGTLVTLIKEAGAGGNITVPVMDTATLTVVTSIGLTTATAAVDMTGIAYISSLPTTVHDGTFYLCVDPYAAPRVAAAPGFIATSQIPVIEIGVTLVTYGGSGSNFDTEYFPDYPETTWIVGYETAIISATMAGETTGTTITVVTSIITTTVEYTQQHGLGTYIVQSANQAFYMGGGTTTLWNPGFYQITFENGTRPAAFPGTTANYVTGSGTNTLTSTVIAVPGAFQTEAFNILTAFGTDEITAVSNMATEAIYPFTAADPFDVVTALIEIGVAAGTAEILYAPSYTTITGDENIVMVDPTTASINVITTFANEIITYTNFTTDVLNNVVHDLEEGEQEIARPDGDPEDFNVLKVGGEITLITSVSPGCSVKYKFLNHDGTPWKTTSVSWAVNDCCTGSPDPDGKVGDHPVEEDCKNFLLLAGKYVNRPVNTAERCPCYTEEPELACAHPSGSEDGPVASVPPWDPLATYNSGDKVTGSDGKVYKSTEDGNTGNDPVTTPGKWKISSLVEPCTIRVHRLQRDWCRYCL